MKKLRTYFVTGLVIVLPVLITIYVLVAMLKFFDNILGRYINALLEATVGFRIFGLGIVLFVFLVLAVGVFAVNFWGKRLFPFFERIFMRMPLVHKIYPATKQMVNFLLSEKKQAFKSVVLLEYPRKGMYSLGFVTNEGFKQEEDKVGRELLHVLVPSTPSPFTGYFVIAPKDEVIYLDISIEDGMKLIVSGGIVNP